MSSVRKRFSEKSALNAPTIGGLNNDAGSAAKTLAGAGGAISYDSTQYQVVGIDHEITKSSKGSDGSNRTWRAALRAGISRLFGGRRKPVPRANELLVEANNDALLGRAGKNARNFSRLNRLHPGPRPPANNGNAGDSGVVHAQPNASGIRVQANIQVNNLTGQIGRAYGAPFTNLQSARTTFNRNKQTLDESFLKRHTMLGRQEKAALKTAKNDIARISKEIDSVSNEGLNRLSNLETTLKASSVNGQIADNEKALILQGRKTALAAMIKLRLPNMTPHNAGQELANLDHYTQSHGVPAVENDDALNESSKKRAQAIRQATQTIDQARASYGNNDATYDKKIAALQDMKSAIKILAANRAFENGPGVARNLRRDIGQLRKNLAIDHAVEHLAKLEEEHGQNPVFQKARTKILDHLTSFGSTRDWSASDDIRRQADAAESINSLVRGLEDGNNVDFLLGGDPRLDDVRLQLKIAAAERTINADVTIVNKGPAINRQTQLITAEHHLSIAQRRLAAQLEVGDDDTVKKLDPDRFGGDAAAPFGRGAKPVYDIASGRHGQQPLPEHKEIDSLKSGKGPNGRLFSGHSMGGVRMDARFLKAVAHDKAGKERAKQVDLLMADVRRLQDDVDDAKDVIDAANQSRTARTQAEKALIDHTHVRITNTDEELQTLCDRKNFLDQKSQTDQGLTELESTELRQKNNKIAELQAERRTYQQRVAAGTEGPMPNRQQDTQLGGFEAQLQAERQSHQAAKQELGQFADYGLDKATAKQIFDTKGGLATKADDGNAYDDRLRSRTKAAIKQDADGQRPAHISDNQHKLVKQSIKNLTQNKMASTEDAIKSNRVVQKIAGDIFNKSSNIMAMQAEISNDFSPEVQANEYQRAVLQTLTDDHSVSVGPRDVETQQKITSRMQPLHAALQTDKNNFVLLSQQLNNEQVRLEDAIKQHDDLDAAYKIAQGEADDENTKLSEKEKQRRSQVINSYADNSSNIVNNINNLQEKVKDLGDQINRTHYKEKDQLDGREAQVLHEISQDAGLQERTARNYEDQFNQALNLRKQGFGNLGQQPIPPQVADDDHDGRPGIPAVSQQQLTHVLRAAVLSARKPGVKLDQYDPTLHKQEIEDLLGDWGIDADTVRPELEDIMTTSLNRKEIERWQKDFAEHDQSRGAGPKLYEPDSSKRWIKNPLKHAVKPFYGAGRADFSKNQVDRRIDHQMRHYMAQIDELTPGSKLRVDYAQSKDIGVDVSAKKGVAKVTVEADIEFGSDSEIEIRCNNKAYQMQIKPGRHLGGAIAASAGLELGKFANLGVSLGVDLEFTRLNGIILNFERGDDPEAAKQKMQKVIEAMATGRDLSVSEWNELTDNVQLVYEKRNEGGIEAGASAEANLTGDMLGSTVAAKAALGATGQMHGRTKTHIISDSENLILQTEKKYNYQATVEIQADARVDFGVAPDKTNINIKEPANQTAKNFQNVSNDMGKGTVRSGMFKGSGADANVDLELGFSTTWERRAYARSSVSMDKSTGLINDAKMDFKATMDGNTMAGDRWRARAGHKLLNRLADWSGHRQDIYSLLHEPDDNAGQPDGPVVMRPNGKHDELSEVFKHTSGSDFLNLQLTLKPEKKDEANDLLIKANALEDPSHGSVTNARKTEAKDLRQQAQKILDDRKNYYPRKINLIPTQMDQIKRSGDYVPGLSELAGTKPGTVLLGTPLAALDPSLQVSKQIGGQLASWSPVTAKLTSTAAEKSELKHELGNEHDLEWQPQPQAMNTFAGLGDAVVVPAVPPLPPVPPAPPQDANANASDDELDDIPGNDDDEDNDLEDQINQNHGTSPAPPPSSSQNASMANDDNTSLSSPNNPPSTGSGSTNNSQNANNDQPKPPPIIQSSIERLNAANHRIYMARSSDKQEELAKELNAITNEYNKLANDPQFSKMRIETIRKNLDISKSDQNAPVSKDIENYNEFGNYLARSGVIVGIAGSNDRLMFTERGAFNDKVDRISINDNNNGFPENDVYRQLPGSNTCHILAPLEALKHSPKGRQHLKSRFNFADKKNATMQLRNAQVVVEKSKPEDLKYGGVGSSNRTELILRGLDIYNHYDTEQKSVGIMNRNGEVQGTFDMLEIPTLQLSNQDLEASRAKAPKQKGSEPINVPSAIQLFEAIKKPNDRVGRLQQLDIWQTTGKTKADRLQAVLQRAKTNGQAVVLNTRQGVHASPKHLTGKLIAGHDVAILGVVDAPAKASGNGKYVRIKDPLEPTPRDVPLAHVLTAIENNGVLAITNIP